MAMATWEVHASEFDDADATAPHPSVRELDTVRAVAERDGGDDRQAAPGSSRVIAGEVLERQRIERLQDLQQLAPGLDIAASNDYDTRVALRGIGDSGSNEINIGMSDSVGLFLDHVYLSRPGMLSGDLTDIDTVQVRAGPQGAFYGYNTTGGAIDIRTRAPSFEPEAQLKQSFGQRGYTQTQAMVSAPLTGAWAGRINVSHAERGGFVYNRYTGHTLGGSRRDGVRGQLLYRKDEDFSLRLSADWQSARSRPVYALARVGEVAGVNLFQQALDAVGAHAVDGRQVDQDGESRTRTTQGGISAVAEWTLAAGYRLRSVTAARYFGFEPLLSDQLDIALYDRSGTDVRDRTRQQSLRLESPRGDRFDYALGLDYTGENLDTFAHDHYGSGSAVTGWYGNASNTGKYVMRWGRLDVDALSVYAQGTWHLDPRWQLAAGVRVSDDRRQGSFRRRNKNDYDSGNLDQHSVLPAAQLNLSWDAVDHLQAHAGVSYSEKPATLNISSGAVSAVGRDSLYIDPERALGAELGVNADGFQHRIDLAVNLFWTQLSDFQTTATDLETGSNYLLNAGKLRSRGLDTTMSVRPWSGFSLDLNATWLDARYLDFANAKCPAEVTLADASAQVCSLTGARVYRSPRLSYTLGLRQEWVDRDNGTWFAATRWSYRSWAYATLDDSALTRIPSYGLLAISAGYTRQQGAHSWSASAWLDNAADRRYYRTLSAGSYGSAYAVLGDPRTFGVSLEYRY